MATRATPARGKEPCRSRSTLVFVAVASVLLSILLVAFLPSRASAQTAEADVFVAQAILAYEEKRYQDALKALEEALKFDPDHVDALYYVGLVNIAEGRVEKAIPPLEKARLKDPKDEAIAFQLGFTYFSRGRYEQAQPLLEQVFAVRPRLENLGYYVGFMRYRKKDYEGALKAFRVGAATDPDVQQLTRFYSGLALGVLGLPQQAASEIEQALRLSPASPLTGPAERLREIVVAQRERERRFKAEARFGGLYDDNVGVNPKPSKDPVVQELRRRSHENTGELGALRLDYSFLKLGQFDTTATYSFFSAYNNELTRFNIVNHLGGLATTYKGVVREKPYQLGLQYTFDTVTLRGAFFSERHTGAPSVTLVENANNLTSLLGRIQGKKFAGGTPGPREEKRDGINYMAGFTHIVRFDEDRYVFKVGYQWDFDDTEGKTARGRNHSYFGNRVLAGAQYGLPWFGVRLKYDLDVHMREYKNINSTLPPLAPGTKRRADTEYNQIVGFTVPLPFKLTLPDVERGPQRDTTFTFAVDYQSTVARANIDVFSFNRNVLSFFFVWQY